MNSFVTISTGTLMVTFFIAAMASYGQAVALYNQYQDSGKNSMLRDIYNDLKPFPTITSKNTRIVADGCLIRKGKNGHFYVRPMDNRRRFEVRLYNGKRSVSKNMFRLDTTTIYPEILLNGKKFEGGYRLESVRLDSLRCISKFDDEFNQSIKYRVLSFDLVVQRGGQIIYSESFEGNRFSAKSVDSLMKIRGGDVILLENIIVVDSDGNQINIPQKRVFDGF